MDHIYICISIYKLYLGCYYLKDSWVLVLHIEPGVGNQRGRSEEVERRGLQHLAVGGLCHAQGAVETASRGWG